MTVIELVFVACLKTMPLACEERSIPYLEPLSPMACLTQAQPQLAQWSGSHPQHTIARWSCRPLDQREIRA